MKRVIALLAFCWLAVLHADSDTFSVSRIENFSNTFLLEERELLAEVKLAPPVTAPTPAPGPSPIPPPPPHMSGFVAMQVINNTGHPDDAVYITVKGQNGSSDACFLGITNGIGSYVLASSSTFSLNYSYLLSTLPGTTGQRYFYVPQPFISARAYFSINYPMYLGVDTAVSPATITDPNSFSLHDPNYYTLYDKVEFTYNNPVASPGANLFINPTAVDFFSLPIALQMINPIPGGLSTSGLAISRNTVLTGAQTVFTTFDLTSSHVWNLLNLPYVGTDGSTTLRIASPGTASATGASSVNPTQVFPSDYLSNAVTYGFNYVTDVWNFYNAGNQLRIDATEICASFGPGCASPSFPAYYHFTGTVDGGGNFNFVNDTANFTFTINAPPPTNCNPFFAGGGFNDTGEANNTPGAIIIRQFTSAFDVGILPKNFPTGTFMNQAYFVSQKSSYYTNNPQWGAPGATNGPFYDLYSKALHSFGYPIYTFAYDDELGQDGTLVGNVETLNTSVVITLEGVDTLVPNPYEDPTTQYTVTFNFNPTHTNLFYRQGTSGAFLSATNAVPIPGLFSSQESTKQLQIMCRDENCNYQTLTLYLKYNIVLPQVSDFTLASGITFTHGSPTTNVTVAIPAFVACSP